ncbi:MAG: four helix bundle protein [Phycisphaerae bacterium]|nr:four helix bundle protein [Phycisphaerae bacterium]
MRDYTKIEAWRLADGLTVAVDERTPSFPREELYGLTSQLRRAASSAPANIVECSARDSKRDDQHFLNIVRGSLAETQPFIHLARRLAHLSAEDTATLRAQGRQTFACLHGLIQAVEKEAGRFSKFTAAVTSRLVLSIMRISPSGPCRLKHISCVASRSTTACPSVSWSLGPLVP